METRVSLKYFVYDCRLVGQPVKMTNFTDKKISDYINGASPFSRSQASPVSPASLFPYNGNYVECEARQPVGQNRMLKNKSFVICVNS